MPGPIKMPDADTLAALDRYIAQNHPDDGAVRTWPVALAPAELLAVFPVIGEPKGQLRFLAPPGFLAHEAIAGDESVHDMATLKSRWVAGCS